MGCQWYLAMTAAELPGYDGSEKAAWMSCRFSSWGTGLSNLPRDLPPHCLVILDDSVPFQDHDPQRIAAQLAESVQTQQASGVLLDLQRQSPHAAALINVISHSLPCPVAVTEAYAREADCGVFLSPPLNMPLDEAVKPWADRKIWLDIPFGVQTFTVTQDGCQISPIVPPEDGQYLHRDEALHCSYQIQTAADHVRFTLYRSPKDLEPILRQASALGIEKAISLRQEFSASC